MNQHLVERSDVVLGNLDGLKLAQLTVVSVLGQEVSQVVKGHVELTHALPLSVVGVQALLLPFSERQNLRTGPPLLSRGLNHHHSVQVRIFRLERMTLNYYVCNLMFDTSREMFSPSHVFVIRYPHQSS